MAGAGQVVVDLVYRPLETPLLGAARQQGARPVDGLGMLVRPGGPAVPPVDGCRAAGGRDVRGGPGPATTVKWPEEAMR